MNKKAKILYYTRFAERYGAEIVIEFLVEVIEELKKANRQGRKVRRK